MKKNMDVRILMMQKGITQYDVGEELGITASWVSRLLRTPLSAEKKEMFVKAINRLAKEEC